VWQVLPTAAAVIAQETKMSHLFKRLTLCVAAHFVNSLPLAAAHLPNQRRCLRILAMSGQPGGGQTG